MTKPLSGKVTNKALCPLRNTYIPNTRGVYRAYITHKQASTHPFPKHLKERVHFKNTNQAIRRILDLVTSLPIVEKSSVEAAS
ncbi:MAG TPA: hypothetical protein PLO56_07845 [Rhodothermales bacterium]|nr:hypothetical protein [Rhodothermales bacterium]